MQQPHELVLHRKHFNYGRTVFVVNVRKSKWWGQPIYQLGAYGRRKFENWIILMRPKERIKVIYG